MTNHYRDAVQLLELAEEHATRGNPEIEEIAVSYAQVHATLAAAPQPWIRCVDQLHDYKLNPAYIVCVERHKDGWLRAVDARGRPHQIASEDAAAVEALIGGQP